MARVAYFELPVDYSLIVIDGLPGSGKSTTAEWLTHQLRQNGVDAFWLQETDTSHPLWWYDFWNGKDYQLPDFDNMPSEIFIEASLKKWKGFAEQTRTVDKTIVAESVFFQNAVAMFLMGGAEPAALREYAREVQNITRGLNPHLVYFHQNDVAGALRRICDLRGKEFEAELFSNMEQFPFLRQRGLMGFEGVSALWREINHLTEALFDEYTIPNWRSKPRQAIGRYIVNKSLTF